MGNEMFIGFILVGCYLTWKVISDGLVEIEEQHDKIQEIRTATEDCRAMALKREEEIKDTEESLHKYREEVKQFAQKEKDMSTRLKAMQEHMGEPRFKIDV